jgi:predicted membrane chloride channel (bestrophin family)
MAKIKRSLLKDIKKAAREIKKQEAQENKNQAQHQVKLTHSQKRQIRKESFNDHKVKVVWNINPGDLVKIKPNASPTGRLVYGLVTWGVKETVQKAPYLGRQKSLSWYESKIRVMTPAGYRFYPASSMIVIS